jgi:hypothetical protein
MPRPSAKRPDRLEKVRRWGDCEISGILVVDEKERRGFYGGQDGMRRREKEKVMW